MQRADDEKLWIVVPAFNEAPTVGHAVRAVLRSGARVIVVDDGSEDLTSAEALKAGAWVARHVVNLGQGAALKTGIDFALHRGAAYVATFDADGQHHVEDIERMLAVLRRRGLDIVLGSRFLGSVENIPAGRRMLLRVAAALTRITSGLPVTDVHNGLRIMTASTARRLRLVQDQMAHASEFLSEIRRLNLRFEEVPVRITYTPYSLEKGQRLTNSFRIVTDLIVGALLR